MELRLINTWKLGPRKSEIKQILSGSISYSIHHPTFVILLDIRNFSSYFPLLKIFGIYCHLSSNETQIICEVDNTLEANLIKYFFKPLIATIFIPFEVELT